MTRRFVPPELLPHGDNSTYVNHRCRCEACKAAHAKRVKEQRAARARLIVADPSVAEHGLNSTYQNWGCRCPECGAAHTAAAAARKPPRLQAPPRR